MRAQAEHFGTAFLSGHVDRVDFSTRPFTLTLDGGQVLRARTLIVATGASAKLLGLPSEMTLMGRGVTTCATCDGFFFRNRRSRSSAAATPRSKRRSTSRSSHRR